MWIVYNRYCFDFFSKMYQEECVKCLWLSFTHNCKPFTQRWLTFLTHLKWFFSWFICILCWIMHSSKHFYLSHNKAIQYYANCLGKPTREQIKGCYCALWDRSQEFYARLQAFYAQAIKIFWHIFKTLIQFIWILCCVMGKLFYPYNKKTENDLKGKPTLEQIKGCYCILHEIVVVLMTKKLSVTIGIWIRLKKKLLKMTFRTKIMFLSLKLHRAGVVRHGTRRTCVTGSFFWTITKL